MRLSDLCGGSSGGYSKMPGGLTGGLGDLSIYEHQQEFNASGTFTVPSGVTNIGFVLVAAGQHGQDAGTNSEGFNYGGNGGAGGDIIFITNIYIDANLSITIGAAAPNAWDDYLVGGDSEIQGLFKTFTVKNISTDIQSSGSIAWYLNGGRGGKGFTPISTAAPSSSSALPAEGGESVPGFGFGGAPGTYTIWGGGGGASYGNGGNGHMNWDSGGGGNVPPGANTGAGGGGGDWLKTYDNHWYSHQGQIASDGKCIIYY